MAIVRKKGSIWARQPQYPVRINWQHPLAQGLVLAPVVTGSLIEVKHDVGLAPAGAAGYSLREGDLFATTGTGSGDVWSQTALPNYLSVSDSISALCVYYGNTVDVTRKRAVRFSNGVNGTILALDHGTPSSSMPTWSIQVVGGTFPSITSSITTSVGVVYTSGVSRQAGASSISLYHNGVEDLSATTIDSSSANLAGAPNQVYIGNNSSTFPLNGGVALTLLWNRILSAEEFKDISNNPWQIFASQQRNIWVSVAGSGATITVDAIASAPTSVINISSVPLISIDTTASSVVSSINISSAALLTIAATTLAPSSTIDIGTAGSVSINGAMEVPTSTLNITIAAGVSINAEASAPTGSINISIAPIVGVTGTMPVPTSAINIESGSSIVTLDGAMPAPTSVMDISISAAMVINAVMDAPVATIDITSTSTIIDINAIALAPSSDIVISSSALATLTAASLAPIASFSFNLGGGGGIAVYPSAPTVLTGISYGPNGNDYLGELTCASSAQAVEILARTNQAVAASLSNCC